MPRRVFRLSAVMAVALLAFLAAAAAGRVAIDLPGTASAIEADLAAPKATPGSAPTRVRLAPAKHTRTAPLVPSTALLAAAALAMFGFSVAVNPAAFGRLPRSTPGRRRSRAPPPRLTS
jgi:hypothetical protein